IVSLADITAGNLVFTPVAGANGTGYASFTFSVSDSNNTYDAAPNTLTVNVISINDAPTFVVRDGMVTTSLSGGDDVAYGVVVQPDGKILVSGSANSDTVLARYNADGTLDMSFGGGDGIVITTLSTGCEGRGVTLQSDGKILVTGFVGTSAHVVRYNADGTLDTSFGGGDGVATFFIAGPGNNTGYAVTVQPDGRIIVGGSNDNGSSSSNYMLTRLLSDGTPDPSFGTGGSLITALSVAPEDAYAITLQPDGKILLTGRAYYTGDYTVVRYHSDGSLDTSFGGGDGVASYLLNLGSAYAASVVLQPDGKIILAGAGSDIGLLRLHSDGSLDTSFGGGDGIVTQSVSASGIDLGIALLQSDGKIIVAGSGGAGAANDVFAAMRFNADGTLDTSFGTGGLITTAVSADMEYARAATLQADGKIVVVGTMYNGSDYDQAIVRYATDGTLDLSFGIMMNTLNGTPTYTENGSPVVLDADVQIVDAELSTANSFTGATLTLARNGGASSDDVFSASGTLSLSSGNVIVSGTNIGIYTNSSGTLTLTFNDNATNTLVNSAMRQIAYSNSSDAPPASVQINWTFNDGNAGSQGPGGALSATGSMTVNITAINDAPTDLALSANTVAENAANGTSVGTVSTTDPDNGDTQSYSLTDTAGGRFAINGSTGQITVANGALLNYEAATSHSVIVRVTDSGGLTYDETFTINLTNVNEAPTGADATVTINEDASHTTTAANFGFSDIDAGDSLSAVRIDTLPGAGSLTLSGVAVTAGQIVSLA
ncbi:cadherin domain-containing protein, partial [Nitrosomonas sp. Nm84]|uniref:cadherin domain-containing protein n=1 Tax=Nitrosomonas sp. Nm84 TaxID=200124 RepID=UPI0015E87C3C